MVFLSKIKISGFEMEVGIRFFREFGGVYADSRGCFRGLVFLLYNSVKVILFWFFFNYIDVEIEDFGGEGKWRFTGVYGWSEYGEKYKICEMMRDLKDYSDLLWVRS